MTVELKPEVEAFIRKRLESGAFATAEEVIERALEFLSLEEDWLAENREHIAAKIQEGWDEAQTGELIEADEVRANVQKGKENWLKEQRLG
jgi:antitoxin ParD1/3/4